MKVKKLVAREIKDTRGNPTVEVKLVTNLGEFVSSAPNGKSRGENEVGVWKKSLKLDIDAVNKYFIEDINFTCFDDLILIEKDFGDRVGGNTMIALEYCFLKALAAAEDKEVWELINPRAKKMPFIIGNIIGGGKHSDGIGPEFQEFHLIPEKNIDFSIEIMKRAHENAGRILKNVDSGFKKKLNDENAWITTLGGKEVLEVMQDVKENMLDEFGGRIHLGIDVAASEFFDKKTKTYVYRKSKNNLNSKDQIKRIISVADEVFYIEDPLEENDFSGFSEIMKKTRGLICGDDLTTTNYDRLLTASKMKSINSIIIKPNQIGSLLEVKKIVEFCKEKGIKMIFSHRSGETSENIIADLAFGFQADFVKFGAFGPGRSEKLQRLKEIEESI